MSVKECVECRADTGEREMITVSEILAFLIGVCAGSIVALILYRHVLYSALDELERRGLI